MSKKKTHYSTYRAPMGLLPSKEQAERENTSISNAIAHKEKWLSLGEENPEWWAEFREKLMEETREEWRADWDDDAATALRKEITEELEARHDIKVEKLHRRNEELQALMEDAHRQCDEERKRANAAEDELLELRT